MTTGVAETRENHGTPGANLAAADPHSRRTAIEPEQKQREGEDGGEEARCDAEEKEAQ